MTKSDFFDLLKKYEDGHCSEAERDLLFRYCHDVQKRVLIDSWSLSEKEASRLRMLRQIDLRIQKLENPPSKKVSAKVIWRGAAVFIGLVAIGILYLQNNGGTPIVPDNAITLELEDGSLKIIEEDSEVIVLNRDGNVIGRQQGKQLVYNSKGYSGELVYNTLNVPYGRAFELHLSDGTRVHLNAGSSIKYPVTFLEGQERKIFVSGEAYLSVSKDSEHPFILTAAKLNVKVLGTEFNVSAYPEDETTEVVLVEGAVSLYPSDQGHGDAEQTHLRPGFKASFDKTAISITKEAVSTGIYTSWRNGELVFRDMSFDNILKKLERRYNVTITNKNKRLSKEIFQASFGQFPPIETVLEEFKEIYKINYYIEGKTILIE